MSFELSHIWASMSVPAKAVALFLLLFAVLSMAVTIERLIAFGRLKAQSREFAQKAAPLIEAWDLDGLVKLAAKYPASSLAKLFTAITNRYVRGVEDGAHNAVDLARHESARRLELIGLELRRGLSILASIGSTGPFVGLLGTVVGIIGAFQGIGSSGSAGLSAVSAGIAEALIETAFGLVVAIPTVLLFNYFSGRATQVELRLEQAAGELLDEMETQYVRIGEQEEAAAA